MGELASGVAHEINNPLAAIHGISELLQMENWPDQVAEDAKKIQEAAQRAAKVVQNLLFFARKSEPEKRYLDLGNVVERALELKARDFELKNILVSVNRPKNLVSTMVDEPQMVQVILNVLTNAEQAIKTLPGAGNITVTIKQTKDMLRLSISDDGPGISAEDVRSIFDPEASVRRPATLPTSYPQASHFSNFANLYNLRTTYGGDRPAAEASPGMPQEKWMVTQEA